MNRSITFTKDDKLLDLYEVLEITRLSKATTYRLIKIKVHPAPIKIGNRSYWLEAEIIALVNASLEERNSRLMIHTEETKY